MVCSKCGSDNVSLQVVSESQLKTKHRGCLWWLLIGWYWLPIKWSFLTVPALIVKILAPKRYKLKTVQKKKYICQNCGHSWNA